MCRRRLLLPRRCLRLSLLGFSPASQKQCGSLPSPARRRRPRWAALPPSSGPAAYPGPCRPGCTPGSTGRRKVWKQGRKELKRGFERVEELEDFLFNRGFFFPRPRTFTTFNQLSLKKTNKTRHHNSLVPSPGTLAAGRVDRPPLPEGPRSDTRRALGDPGRGQGVRLARRSSRGRCLPRGRPAALAVPPRPAAAAMMLEAPSGDGMALWACSCSSRRVSSSRARQGRRGHRRCLRLLEARRGRRGSRASSPRSPGPRARRSPRARGRSAPRGRTRCGRGSREPDPPSSSGGSGPRRAWTCFRQTCARRWRGSTPRRPRTPAG